MLLMIRTHFYLPVVLLVAIVVSGCDRSLELPPDTTVVAECSGKFKYGGTVELKSEFATQVNLLIQNPQNVVNPYVDPAGLTNMAANSGYPYTVTGKLNDPCNDGSVTLYATGQKPVAPFKPPANWKGPKSDKQLINVEGSPIIGTAPDGVTPTQQGALILANNGRGYDVTFTCCPGAANRRYTITDNGSINMNNVTIAPANVTCGAAAGRPSVPPNVNVRGTLNRLNKEGKVILLISGPGGDCRLTTKVERAQ